MWEKLNKKIIKNYLTKERKRNIISELSFEEADEQWKSDSKQRNLYLNEDINVPKKQGKEKITHKSVKKAEESQILIESLILAQDERWRRA